MPSCRPVHITPRLYFLWQTEQCALSSDVARQSIYYVTVKSGQQKTVKVANSESVSCCEKDKSFLLLVESIITRDWAVRRQNSSRTAITTPRKERDVAASQAYKPQFISRAPSSYSISGNLPKPENPLLQHAQRGQ